MQGGAAAVAGDDVSIVAILPDVDDAVAARGERDPRRGDHGDQEKAGRARAIPPETVRVPSHDSPFPTNRNVQLAL
jgi:hypothetical protein